MKTRLGMALCCALLGNAAYAQSSLTLYGVLDSYLGYNQASGKGTIVGLNGGGDMANRFGVRGSEDLGGGLKANFALENGFYEESGAYAVPGTIFNRQSWVGLSNHYGDLRFGVQNSPQFLMLSKFDAFDGATYGSGLVNLTSYVPRYSNVISLESSVFTDFTFRMEVAPGNQPGSVANGSTILTSAEYARGPLYLGANYVQSRSLTGAQPAKSGFLGGSYQLGAGTLHVAFYRGNNVNSTATEAGVYYSTYSVSGEYFVTTLDRVSLGFMFADGSGTNGNAQEGSAMYQHILSKETLLYAVATHIANHGNATFFLHGAGPIPANIPTPGRSVTGVQVGIRHLF
jgi:predicted porin